MDKIEFTLPERNQIYKLNEENQRLEIIENYGVDSTVTDFTQFLGGDPLDNKIDYDDPIAVSMITHTLGDWTANEKAFDLSTGRPKGYYRLYDRNGSYFTKSSCCKYVHRIEGEGYRNVFIVHRDRRTRINRANIHDKTIGVRPVLPFSSISHNCLNKLEVLDRLKLLQAEYGEYPQWLASDQIHRDLRFIFRTKSETINYTGKKYMNRFDEFEYEGKKYISFVADENSAGKVFPWDTNPHSIKIKKGTQYFIEVLPIKWLIDLKENIALSKYILFTGVPFDNREIYEGDFENTTIYKYLNEVFAKDIIPSKIEKEEIKDKKEELANDKQRLELLKHILDGGFIEKNDNEYTIKLTNSNI